MQLFFFNLKSLKQQDIHMKAFKKKNYTSGWPPNSHEIAVFLPYL